MKRAMRSVCGLVVGAGVWGCGSPIVDPGRASHLAPPPQPIPQPANSSGLPTLESPEIQQLPVESLLNVPAESKVATYHTVQSGETLVSIAKRYRVSAEKLRTANGLDPSAKLTAEQLLFIPNDR